METEIPPLNSIAAARALALKKSTNPPQKASEFEFDGMSLDEIIAVKRAMARKETAVIREFDFDFEKDLTLSPMAVLQSIQRTGVLFSVAAKEWTNIDVEGGAKFHRWRAEWTFGKGELTGVGEGARKMLAKQLGALDLVNKLRAEKGMKLPICRIPEGCLISPNILVLLENAVDNLRYDMKYIFDQDNSKVYICMCHVKDKMYTGLNSCPAYAKRVAAKKAYDAMTGRRKRHQLDPIIFGDSCMGPSKFDSIESETSRVTFVRRELTNRDSPKPTAMKKSASSAPGGLVRRVVTITQTQTAIPSDGRVGIGQQPPVAAVRHSLLRKKLAEKKLRNKTKNGTFDTNLFEVDRRLTYFRPSLYELWNDTHKDTDWIPHHEPGYVPFYKNK